MPRGTLVMFTPDGDLVPGTAPGVARIWPFTQPWWLLWRSSRPAAVDPVNLLVLRARPGAVRDALVAAGWHRPDDGTPHRTWVNGTFRHMTDHVALGGRDERVHARLFALGDSTMLAAHHELGPDGRAHVVTSWDRGRAALAGALAGLGYTRISPTGIITPPGLRGVAGDGRAWRLVGG